MGNEYDEFFSWKALRWAGACEHCAAGRFPWPVQFTVYPTNRCNRRCYFCIMEEERRNGLDLPLGTFRKVLDAATANGTRCLHIAGGGEPLLYPHIREVGRFPWTKVLSTNGTLLTPDICRDYTRIRVSVNAGTAGGYTRVTGCGSSEWDALVERLKACCLQPCRPYQIGLGMVVDADTVNEIRPLCDLADRVQADFVHIRPAYYPPGTDSAERLQQAWGDIATAGRLARDSHRTPVFCVGDKFDGHWTRRRYEKCRASPLVAVVTADARFAVCQDVFTKWGDLNTRTVEACWYSRDHEDAIASIDLDKCPRCIMGRHNEIIEHVFVRNDVMVELL